MTRRLAGRLDRLPAPETVRTLLVEEQGRLIADTIGRSLDQMRDRLINLLQASGHGDAAGPVLAHWPAWVAAIVPAELRKTARGDVQ